MKALTNMQKLRKYAKWAKAEYGTDIQVTYDGKVTFRRKLISDWHKEMWEWLAEHPDKDKDEFLESRIIGRKHGGYVTLMNDHNFCFACFYNDVLNIGKDVDKMGIKDICNNCPLCVNKEDYYNSCFVLYTQWLDIITLRKYEEASKIAKQIANLEWKWRDGNEIQK